MVAVTPKPGVSWLRPGIYKVTEGAIRLSNEGEEPVMINKDEHLADIRSCTAQPGLVSSSVKRVHDHVVDKFSYMNHLRSYRDGSKYDLGRNRKIAVKVSVGLIKPCIFPNSSFGSAEL